MTCKHKETIVINSCNTNDVHSKHKMKHPKHEEALFVRRRKCKLCGEKFNTYEVPLSVFEGLVPIESAKRDAYKSILGDFRAFIDGVKP